MRLSTEENDPGYCVEAHTANVTVFLDGEVIPLTITADSQIGYIKYYARGFGGKPIFYEVNGECRRLKLEKRGKVRIEIDP